MIPKIIHYCWFGYGKKSKKIKKCIDSWKKYCPDYEIIEWNENNFDINSNPYTKMCYEEKKYAFLTDYVRLYVVNKYGGIYFDTDVEVIKSIDDLLKYKGFYGFEDKLHINTGEGFGSEARNQIISQMLKEYEPFLDGKKGMLSCPKLNTRAIKKFGLELNNELQEIDGVMFFPAEYFNPLESTTGRLRITKNTYTIHWYSMSWLSPIDKLRSRITRPIHRVFGVDIFHKKNK